MAQTSWPFENIDTNETQFSQWARNIGEGVINDKGLELEPFADSSGMQVKVKTGEALVRGHYYLNDAQVTLTVAPASSTQARVDRIVLRLDPLANSIVLAVKTGTPGASPTPPALEQTDAGVWELNLGLVNVAAAATTIAPSAVTDQRLIFTPWSAAKDASIQAAIAANTASIATNTANIATNTANIATNTADIATANSAIAGKQNTITGAATTITSSNLTASRALTSDGSGKVAVSAVTSTELGYMAGVTSAVQTQLDAKAPLRSQWFTRSANYTLAATDNQNVMRVSSASPITMTIPANVFQSGDRVDIVLQGTQAVTFAAGAGLELLSKNSKVILSNRYGAATVLFYSPTIAYLIGDLS